jgi:hypothetical protein
MPWFRLDDGFYDHRKVAHAGNCAIGLWVRCATWSARHLTDGHIPAEIVRTLGKPREIAALTDAGMWVPTGTEYVMPDYLEYNPSAKEVKEKRRADAERKRDGTKSTGKTAPKPRTNRDPFDD